MDELTTYYNKLTSTNLLTFVVALESGQFHIAALRRLQVTLPILNLLALIQFDLNAVGPFLCLQPVLTNGPEETPTIGLAPLVALMNIVIYHNLHSKNEIISPARESESFATNFCATYVLNVT